MWLPLFNNDATEAWKARAQSLSKERLSNRFSLITQGGKQSFSSRKICCAPISEHALALQQCILARSFLEQQGFTLFSQRRFSENCQIPG